MRVRHLMVPGLSSADLDRGALRNLVDEHTSRARLVSSFPATIAAQEATLLTGAPPARHGVLFAGDEARLPSLIGAWHARLDTLVDGGTVDQLEDRLRAELAETDLLLVSGCPPGDPVGRIVDPPPHTPPGFRLHVDDTFILCEPTRDAGNLPRPVVDAWLATPGIERILAPSIESSGAWMAPADRGWILVTEPGWAFRETALAFGRIDPQRPAVLLGFGPEWATPWPEAVHDWRIAPTVLVAAGESSARCIDTPIEGADRLEG